MTAFFLCAVVFLFCERPRPYSKGNDRHKLNLDMHSKSISKECVSKLKMCFLLCFSVHFSMLQFYWRGTHRTRRRKERRRWESSDIYSEGKKKQTAATGRLQIITYTLNRNRSGTERIHCWSAGDITTRRQHPHHQQKKKHTAWRDEIPNSGSWEGPWNVIKLRKECTEGTIHIILVHSIWS